MTIAVRQDLKDAIFHQLQSGERNAVHKRVLAKYFNIHERIIRETIVEMRHAGVPVIGSQKGYYLAESIEEIQQARSYIKSYVINLCKDMADYKRLLNQVNGQFRTRLN